MRTLFTTMLVLLSATLPLAGEDLDATATGQVHIPLETYQELVRAATDPGDEKKTEELPLAQRDYALYEALNLLKGLTIIKGASS